MYSNCKKKKKPREKRGDDGLKIKNATDWLTKRDGPLNGAQWDAGTRFSNACMQIHFRNFFFN